MVHPVDEKDWHELTKRMKVFCCVSVGSHGALVVTFRLRHEVGYYIMDYYMPSVLLVVTSWVAFWLDTDAVSGRINIGQFKQTARSSHMYIY
jgi:hypothetical protein